MSNKTTFAKKASNLPFTEYDYYEFYREMFERLEPDRIKRLLPLCELAVSFGLASALDTGQPTLEGLPLTRKFKSHAGLRGAEEKLRRCLSDFRFTDIETAAGEIGWGRVRVVSL